MRFLRDFSGCSFSTSYLNNSIKASGLGGSVVNTDDNFHIKVMMPSTFLQRKLIDLLASFVAVDGEAFECELMAKESHNEEFLFLFSTPSKLGYYYRWKTYVNVMGERGGNNEKSTSLYMVNFGQRWTPPLCNSVSGSPTMNLNGSNRRKRKKSDINGNFARNKMNRVDSVRSTKNNAFLRRMQLMDDEISRFVDILRGLSLSRWRIQSAMSFALDHAECAQEVIEMIRENFLSNLISKSSIMMISHLFLFSDILYNSAASVKFAASYRGLIEDFLPMFFEHLNRLYISIDGRITAKNMEERVLSVLQGWKEWSIFPVNFLNGLEATFCRSFDDVQYLHTYSPGNKGDIDAKGLNDDMLDSLRRQATTNGVTFYEDSRNTGHETGMRADMEILQLERKLLYVSLFSTVNHGNVYDLDGEVYDIFKDFDIDGQAIYYEDTHKSHAYEDIDGIALDVLSQPKLD